MSSVFYPQDRKDELTKGTFTWGALIVTSDGSLWSLCSWPVCVLCPPAQQEAQRAQFYVEKAKQDQRHKIIQAEGEAEAAKMVSSSPELEASRLVTYG